MKPLIIIMTLLFSVNMVYSSTYINEINFVDEEFIEIYSDELLNLSKVYDESDSFNTLTLEKEVNSNYYLVIGSSFKSSFDLDNFNCNIYISDKSQVSNGGLRSSGENVTIESNLGNISWSKTENLDFEENETLHFNQENNEYFITQRTPCSESILVEVNETQTNETQENTTEQNETNEQQEESDEDSLPTEEGAGTCDYTFQIDSDLVFTDKLSFKFDTDASEFTIEYWVEDYSNNIVKSKLNTTNKNTKSYTPDDKKEVYNIKANLYVDDGCKLEDSETVFFYTQTEESEENEGSNPTESSLNITDLGDKLGFEVTRGDTAKRTIYLTQNGREILSFELDKYSEVKGDLDIILDLGENIFTISGLDKEQTISIQGAETTGENTSESEESTDDPTPVPSTNHLEIESIFQVNDSINFDLSQADLYEGTCYVYYVRTRVSDKIKIEDLNDSDNIKLDINEYRLKDKKAPKNVSLKLTCKHKKPELSSYKYVHEHFNYTITQEVPLPKKPLYTVKTKTQIFNEDLDSIEKLTNKSYVRSKVEVYNSKNEKIKDDSEKSVLVAMTALLSMLLAKW